MTMIFRTEQDAGPDADTFKRSSTLKTDKNGGARCLFSLDDAWVFPDPVADAARVRNLAYIDNDPFEMSLVLAAGQTVTHTGTGLDFSAMTNDEAYVLGNAGSLSSIHAADQHFLVICWMALPSSSDWNDNAVLLPFFATTDDSESYTTQADMLTIGQQTGNILSARRQTDGATNEALTLTPTSAIYNNVCQIAYWRNGDGSGLRAKSKFGEVSTTGASGADNVGDFSTRRAKWGVPGSFTQLGTLEDHRNGTNTVLHRGLIEDLGVSERDPLTVANEDFQHVLKNTQILI